MDNESRPATALEASLQRWQEINDRIRLQLQPLDDIYRSLDESLEPIRGNQQYQRVIQTGRQVQLAIPTLTAISEQVASFQQAIQASIGSLFPGYEERFRELPEQIQEALLLLGEHGWYLDPQMPLPTLWKLRRWLDSDSVAEAEAVLVAYFEDCLCAMEEDVLTRFPHRSHLIGPAFAAHRRGEYALTVPVLLAQVDGICKETVDQYLFLKRNKKPGTAIYVAQLAANTLTAALLSPLAAVLPISASSNERPEGFSGLNRHMVLHGESLDYATRINSLKAVSLVNYVVRVLSVENSDAE